MTRSLGWLVVLLALAAGPVIAQCDTPIDLGEGEIAFHVPSGYDPATPTPLVILLHGYGASGFLQESYFRLTPLADELGFLYAYPDGVLDPGSNRFWNATDACCDVLNSGVDHSSYLRSLIETIRAQCNVDPYRVYFAGHSNGGFMSYRMACDHADVIAGIASLAGATFADASACAPSKPVHVLQIHGTADETILYDGGHILGTDYPGAVQTAEIWAAYNQCSTESRRLSPNLNLDTTVAGRESVVQRWDDGCRPGGSAELWTIDRGEHVPAISSAFRRGVVEHLLDHPACRGRERLKRPRCSESGTLKLKLRVGVPGDRYSVRLSTGELVEGELGRKGKATIRMPDQAAGGGTAEVTWGCGVSASRPYECP